MFAKLRRRLTLWWTIKRHLTLVDRSVLVACGLELVRLGPPTRSVVIVNSDGSTNGALEVLIGDGYDAEVVTENAVKLYNLDLVELGQADRVLLTKLGLEVMG